MGASIAISSGRSKPAPYFFGTKMALFMLRPQPQVPNRTGIASPFAQAVPFSFRKQSNIGRPTVTATPPTMPLNTRRRVSLLIGFSRQILGDLALRRGFFVLRQRRHTGLDLGDLGERIAQGDGFQQVRNPVALLRERLVQVRQERPVDRRRRATCTVTIDSRHEA